jgi:hypothetical protein
MDMAIITAALTDGRTIYFRDSDVLDYEPTDGYIGAHLVLREAYMSPDVDPYQRLDEDETDSLHDDPHYGIILAAYEKHLRDRQSECDHGVVFDAEAARGLSSQEVRARWPRFFGTCPLGCGFYGCAYASMEHYISGDW